MSMKKRAAAAQTNYADVVGLQVDFENGTATRLAGARGRNAGTDFDCFAPFGGRRRCCLADDGTVNAFYGDADYAEDGSNGQVMVLQPKFYYRVEPLSLDSAPSGTGNLLKKANYFVSPTPKPGFRLHPAFYGEDGEPIDHLFYSAYEASYYDASLGRCFTDGTDTESAIDYAGDRLCSLSGRKPIGGTSKALTRNNAERLAGARGAGWHIDTVKSCAAVQLLMIVEFGSMNLQYALSRGVALIGDQTGVNCSSLTGSTGALGNSSGVAASTVNEKKGVTNTSSSEGSTAVSFRGQENPWGNIWKHLNGINFYCPGASSPGQIFIADDFDFSDERNSGNYRSAGFVLPTANGYYKYPGYGDPECDWLFLPGSIGGTSAAPVGDYATLSQSGAGYSVIQYGGRWDFGAYGGPFCINTQRRATYSNRDFGCRLLFVPS